MAQRGRRFLSFACAAGLVAGSLAVLPAADAAPVAKKVTVSLIGGPVTVKSGGHTWSVGISDLGPGPFITISTAGESDSWNFPALHGFGFRASRKTGHATLLARNSLKPVAFFTLKFSPSSRSRTTCHSGSETTFTGDLSGSFTFKATSRLRFHSPHIRFWFSSLVVDYGCKASPGRTSCSGGSWNAGTGEVSALGSTAGLPGRRHFSVTLNQVSFLSAPQGTLRSLLVFAPEPAPVFDRARETLTVTASSSGRVRGSAVLTSIDPPVITNSACTLHGQRYKKHDAAYHALGATPARHPLEAKSYVAGWLKLSAAGTDGVFDIASFKKA